MPIVEVVRDLVTLLYISIFISLITATLGIIIYEIINKISLNIDRILDNYERWKMERRAKKYKEEKLEKPNWKINGDILEDER